MCKGFPSTRVARLLYEAGALETDKEPGRLTKKVRLPGAGKSAVNCYVIRLGTLLTEQPIDSSAHDAPVPGKTNERV